MKEKEPLETAELLAFSATVETGSLSGAAVQLGVPRATISRRLARLEQRLGTRLLRRTTRSLALTDAGEALHRHARIVLEAVDDAMASIRRTDQAVRGPLRFSAPPIASPGFQAMLCDFAARHPEVRLQLHFSTRHVDLLRSGYDVALRAGTSFEPGLVARSLSRAPMVVVGAPGYLKKHGIPRTARDLRHHRCLMGFARGEVPQTHWPLAAGGEVQVEGSFFSNEIRLLAEAALRGLGLALLPGMMAAAPLESGQLVQVLEGVVGGESQVALVYPEREFLPPQVRAFVEAVIAWAPTELGELSRLRPAPKRRPRRLARPRRRV